MESRKLQKKKRKKKSRASVWRPHSSQQYKLEESLTEEDILFVCLLESSMKSSEKIKKRKKKKKKNDKTEGTLPWMVENLSKYRQEEQDLSPDSDFSGKSIVPRKAKHKRKRIAVKPNNSCAPQKITDISDDPFESPGKKCKKKKLKIPSKFQTSASSLSRIEHLGPGPLNISDGKTHKSSNIEATHDPKCMSTPEDDDGISQGGNKHLLPLHQSNRYNSTPLSSSTALPKTNGDIKLISPGKAKDINGLPNHSQEPLITQKKFGLTQSCSEEPLDLSLPSRIRGKRNVLSPSDDVTKGESRSPPVRLKATKNKKVTFFFNPSKIAKSTKFFQTFLNPAYFFKRKGVPGKAVVTPLIKIRNRGKSYGKRRDPSKLRNGVGL